MKVLIVGSGGREHAIAWSVAKSPKVDKIFCAPGNAGIAEFAECVNIGAMEFDKLVAFAKEHQIDLTIIGDTDETGTRVTFKPDGEIFEELVYDYETLHTRLREQAFQNAGLSITLTDKRGEEPVAEEFCYEGGIREFVKYINTTAKMTLNGMEHAITIVGLTSFKNNNRIKTARIAPINRF